MNGPHVVEYWEVSSTKKPPELIASLLRDDERLLWAARVTSVATARSFFAKGTLAMAIAAVCLVIAPWGQTLDDYCGSNPGRCLILFYGTWPCVAFLAIKGSFQLWSGWKAKHRPWLTTYAISTSCAFLIDESHPRDFRYIYLRLHPPKLSPKGVLGFDGKDKSFAGLDDQSATRALYWATEGRLALAKDEDRRPR